VWSRQSWLSAATVIQTHLCGYFCGCGRLSDCGIRFVLKFGLLGPKARPMDGTADSNGSPAGQGTTTKFTGRKRSCPRKPPLGSPSTSLVLQHGPADCFGSSEICRGDRRWRAPLRRSSACPQADVDLFSCQRAYYQRSVARKTARERRAAGARVRRKSIWEPGGSVAASGIFG